MPVLPRRYVLACRHIHAGCRFVANAATPSHLFEALVSHSEAVHGDRPHLDGLQDCMVLRLTPLNA